MIRRLTFLLAFLACHLFLDAQSLDDFYEIANSVLAKHVKDGRVDYAQLQQMPSEIYALQELIAQADLKKEDKLSVQAFYINAYNILVISQIVEHYPLKSVLDVSGFFDRQKYMVAGEELTLNDIEKKKLLATYNDPRFHFVLVCGAIDCPPLINKTYMPANLEEQLSKQTKLALNNENFIRQNGEQVALSQIFEWYASDFGGGKKSAVEFINQYRKDKLSDKNVGFYSYDWALNGLNDEKESLAGRDIDSTNAANASRYVVSAAVPIGAFEIKGFSNLYHQSTGESNGNSKSTFFTQNISVLAGVLPRFNAGFDLRYRQVSNTGAEGSRFDVFNLEQTATTRQGITGVGPKIRYAPFTRLPNFSIQSTYWVATGKDLTGNSARPYIDWDGDTWFTQFFNDFTIGQRFSLFTELDFLWEDIGKQEDGRINRFSTPVQTILSFFPNPKTTLYAIGSYSPYWQEKYDYFYQGGLGAKYQVTRQFELEVLYTQFRNSYLLSTDGSASTINFGVRISTF